MLSFVEHVISRILCYLCGIFNVRPSWIYKNYDTITMRLLHFDDDFWQTYDQNNDRKVLMFPNRYIIVKRHCQDTAIYALCAPDLYPVTNKVKNETMTQDKHKGVSEVVSPDNVLLSRVLS